MKFGNYWGHDSGRHTAAHIATAEDNVFTQLQSLAVSSVFTDDREWRLLQQGVTASAQTKAHASEAVTKYDLQIDKSTQLGQEF